MSLVLAAISIAALPPRQPTREIFGRHKLVLRRLGIPDLASDAYVVISQGSSLEEPILVRLKVRGKSRSTARFPCIFSATIGKPRLFRRGHDFLLAFWSGTGTTMYTNFVRIVGSPPRLVADRDINKLMFEYAPMHHFQADGRFDEHIRHWDDLPGLYTRHWIWSTGKHRFVVTGHARLFHWNGWDDLTLR